MGKENGVPFTDTELLYMAGSPYPMSGDTGLWQRAFILYNSDAKNEKLSIGCRPCYNKVLVYFLQMRFDSTVPPESVGDKKFSLSTAEIESAALEDYQKQTKYDNAYDRRKGFIEGVKWCASAYNTHTKQKQNEER